jgi:hypothetical protein
VAWRIVLSARLGLADGPCPECVSCSRDSPSRSQALPLEAEVHSRGANSNTGPLCARSLRAQHDQGLPSRPRLAASREVTFSPSSFAVRDEISTSRTRLWASIMAQDERTALRSRSPLPPPPPSAYSGQAQGYQAPQTSPLRRLAVQPPRLRTALAPQQGPYGQLQTPASASNLSVPYSPFVASSPSSYAPSPLPSASPMAMRNTSVPYNPQQWGRTGPAGGQYAPHPAVQTIARTHDMTGMEGNSRPFLESGALCSIPSCSGNNPTISLRAFFMLLWRKTDHP